AAAASSGEPAAPAETTAPAETMAPAAPLPLTAAADAVAPSPSRSALGWVDDEALGPWHPPADSGPDLLARPRRRPLLRPSILVPAGGIPVLAAAYAAAALLWPLHAVAPTVAPVEVAPVTAPASAPVWPEQGSAAVGVDGIGSPAASTAAASSMASITKVVTVL